MHARLSPSAAHRWLNCPASLLHNEETEGEESEYAKEGTVAHALAAECLIKGSDLTGDEPYTLDGVEVTPEMHAFIMEYVNTIRALAVGKNLVVEERICLEHLVKDCYGTADAIIFDDDTIEVHDLKFGRGKKVEAEGNEQLLIYLLGAVDKFMLVDEPKSMKVFIHQPRNGGTSEWEVPMEVLQDFASRLKERAKAAIDYADNGIEPSFPLYCVSEQTCMFCKAKSLCRARAEQVLEVVFDDLTEKKAKDISLLTNDELAELMPLAKTIISFGEDLLKTVTSKLLSGEVVNGYKLVEGKKGMRKWTDENLVAAYLRNTLKLKVDEIYEKSLISPATAEKVVPKAKWDKIASFITQSEGKPTVAEVSDKRAEYSILKFENDNSDLI